MTIQLGKGHPRALGHWNVRKARKFQVVGYAARSVPSRVEVRGNPDDLGARPTEQKRECAGVVRVSPKVCVKVDSHVPLQAAQRLP